MYYTHGKVYSFPVPDIAELDLFQHQRFRTRGPERQDRYVRVIS